MTQESSQGNKCPRCGEELKVRKTYQPGESESLSRPDIIRWCPSCNYLSIEVNSIME